MNKFSRRKSEEKEYYCNKCDKLLGVLDKDNILETDEFTSFYESYDPYDLSSITLSSRRNYLSPGKIQIYEEGPNLICQECTRWPKDY